jgi:hypothetical protein
MTDASTGKPPRSADIAGKLGILAASLAVLAFRAPNVLLWPRFFAEEGKFYFSHAFDYGFLEALRYVQIRAGYVNLVENFAAAFASLARLEFAPFVTTTIALLVQTLPLLVILFGDSSVFRGLAKKSVGCAIVVLAPSISGETWLTSVQSHIYLGLVSLLILLEKLDPIGGTRRWSYRILLALGGLSGPYTVFLLPLFAMRAFVERRRERIVQAAIVTLAFVVQVLVFWNFFVANPSVHALRKKELGLGILSRVLRLEIGAPLFGLEAGGGLAKSLVSFGEHWFLLAYLAILPIALIDWKRRRLRPLDSRALLFLSFSVLTLGIAAFSFGIDLDGRYAVLPGYVLLFYLLDNIRTTNPRWIAASLALLLVLSCFVSLRNYRASNALLCDGLSPTNWKLQVARWRNEEAQARLWKREVDDRIAICPPGRVMKLHRRDAETPESK